MSLYEIAFHLGIPLYKLKEEMPYDELLGWFAYFERRPVGWREDDRTFKLLQSWGAKGRPEVFFPSLGPIYKPPVVQEEAIDGKKFKNSIFFQKMQRAVGGDKVSF